MTPNPSPLNLAARWTLQRLRPPSRKKLYVLDSYVAQGNADDPVLGNAYRLEPNELVLAAGEGRVTVIQQAFPIWRYSGTALGSRLTYVVTVDHGNDILTTVHGLASCAVKMSQSVRRGDALGAPLTDEIFFQVKRGGTPFNPNSISRHFRVQDGAHALGRTGYLREAPDRQRPTFAAQVRQIIVRGIRYFVSLFPKPPILVNIDFNGSAYTGPAAVGASGDYWNPYESVDYQAVVGGCYCGYAYGTPEACFTYSAIPYLYLLDHAQVDRRIWLERVSPIADSSGTTPTWDTMLGTWIGGYDSGVPYSTVFRIHGLPPGNYSLYLYSDQTYLGSGTDYYVQVDSGPVQHAALTPTGALAWTQNDNYVLFSGLSLVSGSTLRIEVLGFVAGLQLHRI
jgi:hypothetical protein